MTLALISNSAWCCRGGLAGWLDVRAQGDPDQARHHLGERARRAVRPRADVADAHHDVMLGDACEK